MTDSLKMVQIAYKALEEKKAEDITVIDISNITSICDYFIITNGTSQPHLASLIDEVSKELEKAGYMSKTVEGGRSSTWTLLDYFDIVVHVFTKEDRDFYDLERIWRDGRFVSREEIFSN
ncbi:MAG: ribosome silencing factor [Clostridiales bacterium]|nr:ribosome silencing factor [Clostridiales bacterium]